MACSPLKTVRSLIKVAVIAWGTLLPSVVQGSPKDRADEVNAMLTEYRKLLTAKIATTPFDCGRAILMPAFDPETSTSIYAVEQNHRRSYYLTCVQARANLWQATDGLRFRGKADAVRVDRVDAELPERTALLVKKVWGRMLSGRKLSASPSRGTRTVSVDASYVDFSIDRPNLPPLQRSVELSSTTSTEVHRLIDVWNTLYDYAKAPANNRAAIAGKIEKQCERILSGGTR